MVRDIVNFLDYIGEPMQLKRRRSALGIAFLLIFMLFAYLLKRRDLERRPLGGPS